MATHDEQFLRHAIALAHSKRAKKAPSHLARFSLWTLSSQPKPTIGAQRFSSPLVTRS